MDVFLRMVPTYVIPISSLLQLSGLFPGRTVWRDGGHGCTPFPKPEEVLIHLVKSYMTSTSWICPLVVAGSVEKWLTTFLMKCILMRHHFSFLQCERMLCYLVDLFQ